jgi:hypothetical protein
MSVSRGDIVSTTLRALRRTGDENDKATVESFVNRFYFELCAAIPVSALRRRVEVDLASADYSDGMWLPANMSGLLRVKDVEDGFDYINRDRAAVTPEENTNLCYTYVPSDDPAYIGDDAVVQKGGTTFESELADDHTGEYIKFASEPGYYLLTAAKTFTPTYWGRNIETEDFVIRPRGTQKLVCLDADSEEITDTSVYVDYWEYPQPLYQDTDCPLLPSTRALELLVMKESMSVIGKRQLSSATFRAEIDDAMNELRKMSPSPNPPQVARDRFNKVFTFATNIFGDRG